MPTRPPRRSGLCFVRGEKLEERELSGDEDGALKTSTLRDYRRKHHAEVTALGQVADLVADLAAQEACLSVDALGGVSCGRPLAACFG